MKLDDVCAVFDRSDFPAANAREHPDRTSVLAAREAVTAAVTDDEFLIDCMAHELGVLERRVPRQGLVSFHTMAATGVRFAFGYWAPGQSAGAHEHTAWTITAVCRNQLSVRTFDREESVRTQTLVPKNVFDAPAGRVGFIYEPCIHDPCNPTNTWSLSLHVISPRDGEKSEQDMCLPVLDEIKSRRSISFGHPSAWVPFARYQHLLIDQIARLAAGIDIAAAGRILARCRSLGSAETRRFIDSLGRTAVEKTSGTASLTIVHERLALSCRDLDGGVALGVETPDGWVEQMRMSRAGREAMRFCSGRTSFGVADIPGRLTSQERWAIAEALEKSGMFRMEVC